jgi:hypothetical protein
MPVSISEIAAGSSKASVTTPEDATPIDSPETDMEPVASPGGVTPLVDSPDGTEQTPGPPESRTARLGRAWHWLLAFSFPRRFPVVQFPNLPLALAFVGGQAASRLHGSAHFYAQGISYLSMAVWAYLELFEGVNWFRRLLGAFYVASTAVHLEHALNH